MLFYLFFCLFLEKELEELLVTGFPRKHAAKPKKINVKPEKPCLPRRTYKSTRVHVHFEAYIVLHDRIKILTPHYLSAFPSL